MIFFFLQAPYLIYVEVLECDHPQTSPVPCKVLENTLRYTRSEEDLSVYYQKAAEGSPRPIEFSVYGNHHNGYDDGDCWSLEGDDIIQVMILKIHSRHMVLASRASGCLFGHPNP